MLQLLSGLEIGDLSEVLGGLGDMWGDALSDPMWWINIVNGSVSPKFLKPAGKFMGSFIRGLGDGAISLLNKTGRLGYKIRHIAGEVALYTNLEIEIARFNSRGVLRPLHWAIFYTMISVKIFPAQGKYADSLRDVLRKYPRQTIGKLRRFGIEDDALIDLTRLLFVSPSDEISKTQLIDYVNYSE